MFKFPMPDSCSFLQRSNRDNPDRKHNKLVWDVYAPGQEGSAVGDLKSPRTSLVLLLDLSAAFGTLNQVQVYLSHIIIRYNYIQDVIIVKRISVGSFKRAIKNKC